MLKHRLSLFVYFYIYVSISFFFAPYLKGVKEFAPETVGYLTSLSLLLLIISFFISGILADRINSNKRIIIANLAISVFAIVGLVYITNVVLLSICYILSFTSFIMLTSQLDGLVIRDISNTEKYGTVRSFGSFGAAVSYFVNSYALNDFKLEYNLLLNAGLVILLIVLITSIKETHYQKSAKLSDYKNAVIHSLSVKPILYILIITFLTYGTLGADDAYQVMYNTEVVMITATVMGIVGFLSIFSEGIFMSIHTFILKHFGITKTINIAIVTLLLIYITRFTMYTTPVVINIGSILMGVFIGFYVPSAILIINKYINEDTKNIFLSLYQMMIKFGGVLLGLITTIYFDLTNNLQNIYLVHALIIASSLLVVRLLSKEIKNQF